VLRKLAVTAIAALALAAAPGARAAGDQTGQIDWTRRVIKARGVGAPVLDSGSISSARLKAEGAAKADAARNLLEVLQGVELTSGDKLGTMLQSDTTLVAKVRGSIVGMKVVDKHYFSDTGVSVDVEVPLDKLPPELLAKLKAPSAAPAAAPVAVDVPTPVRVDGNGIIDFQKKVLRARGQGMPDLANSANVATAREGAERAAQLDAIAQLLRALKSASFDDGRGGGSIDAALGKDDALRAKVEGTLSGYRIVARKYYKDGGVACDVELDFDKLPPELGKLIQAPKAP
jgi:hypothetical protein